MATEAESVLSLSSLFRGGMENQQNEPNFPIHLTRESFSSSSLAAAKMEIDDAQKRFHNVIIFRPLEPLTGHVGTWEGYAKVHESAIPSLQLLHVVPRHLVTIRYLQQLCLGLFIQ